MAKGKKPKPDKKAAATAAAPKETVTAKDVTSMIPAAVLKSILAKDKTTKKTQSELAGELGQKIADAVDRFGTNRKALATIRMLNRMEPEKVADYLDHLEYMLDISGIEDKAVDARKERLPMGDTPGEVEDEKETATPPAPDAQVSRPRLVQ
jgi:hypothetical protein